MDIFLTLISMGIGGFVTWLVSQHYYKKAGEELKEEAKDLRTLSRMILRWLEVEGNNIEIKRDGNGNPVGLTRTAGTTDAVEISDIKVNKIDLKRINKDKN